MSQNFQFSHGGILANKWGGSQEDNELGKIFLWGSHPVEIKIFSDIAIAEDVLAQRCRKHPVISQTFAK